MFDTIEGTAMCRMSLLTVFLKKFIFYCENSIKITCFTCALHGVLLDYNSIEFPLGLGNTHATSLNR